ncbi:MAG: hypothetical protein ACRD2W_16440 [Acidimicrobiales bacterium]
MACGEILEAIEWAKKGTATQKHPVTAFLTIHIGMRGQPGSPVGTDVCIYAYGNVTYVAEPEPHVAGDLQYFGNGVKMVPDMLKKKDMTIAVKVFGSGKFSYQYKFKGKPTVGQPTSVTGTCIQDVLLTTNVLSDIITIGLRRDPVKPA